MQYYYQDLFHDHWITIIPMIEYNYATPEYDNDFMVLGQYIHQDANSLRQSIRLWNKKSFNRLIIYQLEPLVDQHWHKIEHIINQIKNADEVWDYDLQNIEILHSYGINAKWRPILYSPQLEVIQNKIDPEIDVLFIGTFTEHREKFFRDITRYMDLTNDELDYFDINFVWANFLKGNKLNSLIANSKICLNLNLYQSNDRQKQSRISYLLNNNKFVLTEGSEVNYYGDNVVQFTDRLDFKNKVLNIIRNNSWKTTASSFKRTRTKTAIFYHLDQTKEYWDESFQRQFLKLQQNGLYDDADYIHLGINGNDDLPLNFYKINRICKAYEHTEYNTLRHLWHFAKSNPDYKILYINSNILHNNIDITHDTLISWQNYIEHFVIDKHQECKILLDNHDCVGTEWLIDQDLNLPNFFGNTFWARGDYISKLEFTLLHKDFNHFSSVWLGMAEPNYYSFKNINLPSLQTPIDPAIYV